MENVSNKFTVMPIEQLMNATERIINFLCLRSRLHYPGPSGGFLYASKAMVSSQASIPMSMRKLLEKIGRSESSRTHVPGRINF